MQAIWVFPVSLAMLRMSFSDHFLFVIRQFMHASVHPSSEPKGQLSNTSKAIGVTCP